MLMHGGHQAQELLITAHQYLFRDGLNIELAHVLRYDPVKGLA